jgi:hypothetical protein
MAANPTAMTASLDFISVLSFVMRLFVVRSFEAWSGGSSEMEGIN